MDAISELKKKIKPPFLPYSAFFFLSTIAFESPQRGGEGWKDPLSSPFLRPLEAWVGGWLMRTFCPLVLPPLSNKVFSLPSCAWDKKS